VSDARNVELAGILARLAQNADDEGEWAALYRVLRPLVLSISLRMLSGAFEIAEDATQEVFIRLLRHKPFRRITDPAAFRGLVGRISQNVAIDYRRRLLRESAARESVDVEKIGIDMGPTVDVSNALRARLNAHEQQLLSLLLEGHTLAETAEALGITYGAAGVRVHRLRRHLETLLGQRGKAS
jgi:RNA polymerase sigma factor (sigma-70 family)